MTEADPSVETVPVPRSGRGWRPLLALLAAWQAAALLWAGYAWWRQPADAPLPPDPPAVADAFAAIRAGAPPDARLDDVLRPLRDIPAPPSDTVSDDASPPPWQPGMEVDAYKASWMRHHVVLPAWRRYDAEDGRARAEALLTLGKAYLFLEKRDAAYTCLAAAAWQAWEHPALRRTVLAEMAMPNDEHWASETDDRAFAALRLVAEMDREAFARGQWDEARQREEDDREHGVFLSSSLVRPDHQWTYYAEKLRLRGAPREGRDYVALQLAARVRDNRARGTAGRDTTEFEERLELAQWYWNAGLYPSAAWTLQQLSPFYSFSAGTCGRSHFLESQSAFLTTGSALLSGPVALVTGAFRRPAETLPLAMLLFPFGLFLWAVYRPRWTPRFVWVEVDGEERLSREEDEKETPPERFVYHDARWTPLFWCHAPVLAWMLWMVYPQTAMPELFMRFMLLGFMAALTAWSLCCVWLWPRVFGPRVDAVELSDDGVATFQGFFPWERIAWMDVKPDCFTTCLRLGLKPVDAGRRRGIFLMLPYDAPVVRDFARAVRARHPDPAFQDFTAEFDGAAWRPSKGTYAVLGALALAFAWPLFGSPHSLLAPAGTALFFRAPFHTPLGQWLLWAGLSLAALILLVGVKRPGGRAGRWVAGVCQLLPMAMLFGWVDAVLLGDEPRWLFSAIYASGCVAAVTALVTLGRPERVARRRGWYAGAVLLALPALCWLAEQAQWRRQEAALPREALVLSEKPLRQLSLHMDGPACEVFAAVENQLRQTTIPLATWSASAWQDVQRGDRAWVVADGAKRLTWRVRRTIAWPKYYTPPSEDPDLDPMMGMGMGRMPLPAPEDENPMAVEEAPGLYLSEQVVATVTTLASGEAYTLPLGSQAGSPLLSPDGRYAAWNETDADGRRRVRVWNLADDREEPLDCSLPRETLYMTSTNSLLAPQWMPDGALAVAFNAAAPSPKEAPESWPYYYFEPKPEPYRLTQWLWRPGSETLRRETKHAAYAWELLPDPDRVVAFQAPRKYRGNTPRTLENLATGETTPLPPAFCSDGYRQQVTHAATRRLYAVTSYSESPRLIVFDWTTGQTIRTLALPPVMAEAFVNDISPDGRYALMYTSPGFTVRVWLVDVETGRIEELRVRRDGRVLTLSPFGPIHDNARLFSSDGRWVILPAWRSIMGDEPTLFRIRVPE